MWLLFYRARYYNPSVGRFSTEDLAKEFINSYAYVRNNPLHYGDPSGLAAVAPPPDVPPPSDCKAGSWQLTGSEDHLNRKCGDWEILRYETATGGGPGQMPGYGVKRFDRAIFGPQCWCVWALAGIRSFYITVADWQREIECPPCDTIAYQTFSTSSDEWIRYDPIMRSPGTPPTQTKTMGIFDFGDRKCKLCDEPCW